MTPHEPKQSQGPLCLPLTVNAKTRVVMNVKGEIIFDDSCGEWGEAFLPVSEAIVESCNSHAALVQKVAELKARDAFLLAQYNELKQEREELKKADPDRTFWFEKAKLSDKVAFNLGNRVEELEKQLATEIQVRNENFVEIGKLRGRNSLLEAVAEAAQCALSRLVNHGKDCLCPECSRCRDRYRFLYAALVTTKPDEHKEGAQEK